MAVTNGWGQAAVNNTIDYGKGKTTATNDWGKVYDSSASGDTSLGTAAAFTNTKSIELDGVDDYITMGTGTLLFNRTTTFTFSVWVKMQQSELSVIIGKSFNGGNYDGYMLWTNTSGSGNTLNFRLRKSTSQLVQFESTSAFNLNQWYHVAAF